MTLALSTLAPVARRELHDGWSLAAGAGPVPVDVAGRVFPATVPGCVHVDLLAAGAIADPYLDNNEAATAWIGLTDWVYTTSFEWQPDGHTRHDLAFDGLDTVATVRLNGAVVLESANQHRSYRVDVRDHLVDGANRLEVSFRAPVPWADARSMEYGPRPRPYPHPYEAIRKSACSFGWDWGIATFTSGIWRPVRLESWSVARIAEVRLAATPVGSGGRIDALVLVERDFDGDVAVVLEAAGSRAEAIVPAGSDRAAVSLDLPEVQLWWPVGHGDQPLYGALLTLEADGRTVDEASRRVGFRTVVWDTTPDDAGTPFTLLVNGRPVFVKGANWIPDDALVTRVDRDRYARRLRQAVAANLNLVRVWGGGIYESEDFYDLCDELGLLTWQDFLFACAAYPEEEPLRSEIEAEAREQIVRLAAHPSLVLLTGNNESVWGYEDWGWKTSLDGQTWGAYYYHELFPALVAELAPHVAYSHGSPFSPNGAHPNEEAHGTQHLWEQWNRQDYLTYRDHRPRFVSEFGWQGPAAWTTMRRAVSDEPLTPESPGMIVHQKAMEGNVKLTNGLLPHFRMPRTMDAWHWAMQLNQAHAVGFALDHFRSLAPRCMGAVVWQLNDCWPVTSWAAIDGDERLKPLWYAMKHSFAPRVVTLQPRDGDLAAVIGNDTAHAWSGRLVVRRLGLDGAVLAEETHAFEVSGRATATVFVDASVATPGDPAGELLVAAVEGAAERGLWFYAEPRDSLLRPAELDVAVTAVDGGSEVRVAARTLARDVTLLVDKVDPDAVVDDALVTLLPGESVVFTVRHGDGVDASRFTSPEVLRTANELVVRA
ncbi:glycoside hydrolase family 2 protein [Tessaracoccus sp. G1721]